MAGFGIYFDALSGCADRALSISNQFKSMADEAPPAVSLSCFGTLGGKSGKLAAAVGKLEEKIDAEARHAQKNLKGVEGALHQVVTNIKRADNPDNPDNRVQT
ncbi:hypothetical protein [Nonomuraea sp. NPDC048916]|uniref:hypothetical protein n=1 Tax=Nonomuraea sp. NPDC048916 TaxID=3154232 RepID=UPI0033D1E534